MKKALLGITVLGLFLFCTIITATAQSPPKAVKEALNSIVALEIEDAQGKTVPRGLGFLVSQNQVATRLTNITDFTRSRGGDKIYVKLVSQERRFAVESILVSDTLHDLVLLKVLIPGVQPLSLSDEDQYRDTTIYTLSDPPEQEFAKGIIEGNSGSGEYIRMSNPVSLKNRGGAVLNNRGQVIGVSMLLLPDRSNPFSYQENSGGNSLSLYIDATSTYIGANFAVSSKILATLVSEAKRDPAKPRQKK